MTEGYPDEGAPDAASDATSEPPMIRRSSFTPPPPDTEPPTFDDDALAEAMAAEVRPYTEPIRLPMMPPPVGSEVAGPPPPVTPATVPSAPGQASRPPSAAEAGLEVEPAVDLEGASTLEAIERLERELRMLSTTGTASTPLVQPEAPAAQPAETPATQHEAPAASAPEPGPSPTGSEPGGPGVLPWLAPPTPSTPAEDLLAAPLPVTPADPVDLPTTTTAPPTNAIPDYPAASHFFPRGYDPIVPPPPAEAPAPPIADVAGSEVPFGAPQATSTPTFGEVPPGPLPGTDALGWNAAPEAAAPEPTFAPEAAIAESVLTPEPAIAPEPLVMPEPPVMSEVTAPDTVQPAVPEALAWFTPPAAPAVADAAPIPGLPPVDASLIEPALAATLPPLDEAPPEPESRPWTAPEPAEEPAATATPAPPVVPVAPAQSEGPAADLPVAVPISTTPPTEPEPPDWLDAPPPVYSPPELVEPPPFVDTPPASAVESVPPITASTMSALPMPLPTDQPNIADRAELPPPPGYENIPILSGDAAAAPVGAATRDPFESLVASPAASPVEQPSSFDHDDDDVIDAVDRVGGAETGVDALVSGAAPVSASDADAAEPAAPLSEPVASARLPEGEAALVGAKVQQPPAFEIETAGVEPTALDLRAGRASRLFWLWFAANSSVISVGLGAVLLGTGMSLRQAIVATLAGVAISFLPLGLGTLAGKRSGQPTMIVSRASFGHAGNILPALLAVVTRVLWGGALLWLLATAVAQVLVGAGLDAGLGTTIWQLVGLVAGFVIVTVVAVFGYGFVAKVQLVLSIVSGLLIVGTVALTAQHLDFGTALTVPDGSWLLVVPGAVLVFSVVGLAWVHSSSDLARYQRPAGFGGSSMLWATFGATLPPFLLIAWGAMLAASDHALATSLARNPLTAIATLLPAWYPAPLLAAAALGLLSAAILTIYSGGFAVQAVGLRIRRSIGTLVSALLVLVAAAALLFLVADFGALARDLLTTIAVPVAAWAGIFASEMMIRTRRFHTPSLLAPGGIYPQIRWVNFLGLIVVSLIGLGLISSTAAGLSWEGFLFGPLGAGSGSPFATSDIGVFVALLLGLAVPLAAGVPAIRRQERTAVA